MNSNTLWQSTSTPFVCQLCGSSGKALNYSNRHSKLRPLGYSSAFTKTACSCFSLRVNFDSIQTCTDLGNLSVKTIRAISLHVQMHFDAKPFRCDVPGCSYTLANSSITYLYMHFQHTHNNAGAICPLCGNLVKHLKKHLQLHKTDTPGVFKCTHLLICRGTTFSSTDELKKHNMLMPSLKNKRRWQHSGFLSQ